jgi:3'-phosphoadenosine 5'-phosphosulfate sulfotransferase (PAPS reductase)/FAD synthetase
MCRLTHLQHLEAESIQVLREAVAESERPVMLYSVGKDSSVLLHLAIKAFHPSKPPFPLLHVDTTWKFRAMYDASRSSRCTSPSRDRWSSATAPWSWSTTTGCPSNRGRSRRSPGEEPEKRSVRFRTLGCYPLTGAIESTASTLTEIIQEMLLTTSSEWQGRVIDHDSTGSMEKKKQEGYFSPSPSPTTWM